MMRLYASIEMAAAIMLCACLNSCGPMFGSHSLGGDLYLLEGDKKEDQVIVYNSNGSAVSGIAGGAYVIPSGNKHYDSTGYWQYVDAAVADRKWILARTVDVHTGKHSFWLVSKSYDVEQMRAENEHFDSAIQSYISGPLTEAELEARKLRDGITLTIK